MGPKTRSRIYLDFETKYDWGRIANNLKRDKKILTCLNLTNVRYKTSSAHRGAFCQFPFRWIYYYGTFIYYVITFLGFLDPPPPLCQHVFSTKNKQKLAISVIDGN